MLKAGGALCALGLPAGLAAKESLPDVTVYLSPDCDCCHRWQKHMRASGFALTTVVLDDVMPVKRQLGVPEALQSCHTAVVGAYIVEGHVPAADIKRLLRERSASGLAVPGMVAGSPGMEGAAAKSYATIAFDGAGSRVFARH
jgi:hypothetical protein